MRDSILWIEYVITSKSVPNAYTAEVILKLTPTSSSHAPDLEDLDLDHGQMQHPMVEPQPLYLGEHHLMGCKTEVEDHA